MEPGRASRTAMLVAAYRARASRREPRICDDPWAAGLAGDEGGELARRLDAINPHMELWIAVRTAFLDAALARLAPPATQVVVLGAGLDTRAARLARPGARFFEVDQPDSQRHKRQRISELDGYPADAAQYVSCDFEHEDFVDALWADGFDTDEPAVVVWEGVTYYLSEPAVRATLGRIARACHPRSTVLFDFVGKNMASGQVRHDDDRDTIGLVSDLGEPFKWGVNDVLPLLYQEGYRRVHVTSFDEACLDLTGTYERERKFRFQYLAEASVEHPRGERP